MCNSACDHVQGGICRGIIIENCIDYGAPQVNFSLIHFLIDNLEYIYLFF